MSSSERPKLESERKRAKKLLRAWRSADTGALARLRAHHPRFARGAEPRPEALKLADALLVVAREVGFPSWPRLKQHAEELAASADERVELFVAAACSGDVARAERLLARDPALAHAGLATALVVADEPRSLAALERDPSLATRGIGPKGWPPLPYLTLSRVGSRDPASRRARCRIAERLLALGADANATTATPEHPQEPLSALYGAVGRNDHPELARILLEAGADPNDGESLYHAAEGMHEACLSLLLAHGVNPDEPGGSWRTTPLTFLLGYREVHGMARVADRGIRWLLEHGADPNRPSGDERETAMHRAAGNGRSVAMLELLAAHGADLRARRSDGRTPHELAVLHGNADAAAWLAARGAAAPPRRGGEAPPGLRTRGRRGCARPARDGARLAVSTRRRAEGAGVLVGRTGAPRRREPDARPRLSHRRSGAGRRDAASRRELERSGRHGRAPAGARGAARSPLRGLREPSPRLVRPRLGRVPQPRRRLRRHRRAPGRRGSRPDGPREPLGRRPDRDGQRGGGRRAPGPRRSGLMRSGLVAFVSGAGDRGGRSRRTTER